MSGETLVRVVAPSFVAGFVVQAGRCIVAAPILRRSLMGKSADEIRNIVARRGWKAHIVTAPPAAIGSPGAGK